MAPWTVTHQAPLSVGFSRSEYWSGLPCPPPGDLLDPGTEPKSPTLTGGFSPRSQIGSPENRICVASSCSLSPSLLWERRERVEPTFSPGDQSSGGQQKAELERAQTEARVGFSDLGKECPPRPPSEDTRCNSRFLVADYASDTLPPVPKRQIFVCGNVCLISRCSRLPLWTLDWEPVSGLIG